MQKLLAKWLEGLKGESYSDGEIELKLVRDEEPCSYNDHARTVYFDIRGCRSHLCMGYCELRLGMNRSLYYLGQIGYTVLPAYRGNHIAYKACRILFDLAYRKYGMNTLIITCNPDNAPSYKTLVKLGGSLKEIVDVPEDHSLYRQGDRQKCIFCYDLEAYYPERSC